MATFVPAKRATEYIFYTALIARSDSQTLQSNPTIAAGDFKVSKDGGALANLTTLPAVTPASSVMVKITLSSTEMTADQVSVVCIDAAGDEWCDQFHNIQTAARQVDDLAFPTTSGRSLDVTAGGAAGVDWGNVENPTTAVNLSATNIDTDQVVASVAGAVGSVTGLTAADVGAIKAKTDNLPTDPADQSLIIAATDAIIADTEDIQARLPAALVGGRIDASVGAMAAGTVTASALAADAVDEIWDEAVDGAVTARESMRLHNAAMGGKASGLETTTAIYRDLADSKDRITATVDADGNRTAVVRDLT